MKGCHKNHHKIAFHFFHPFSKIKKKVFFFSPKKNKKATFHGDDDNEWKVSMLSADEIWVALCNPCSFFPLPDSNCIVKWLKALPLLNSTGEISSIPIFHVFLFFLHKKNWKRKAIKILLALFKQSPPATERGKVFVFNKTWKIFYLVFSSFFISFVPTRAPLAAFI